LSLQVDVLFTTGTQVARIVQQATTTIPVVVVSGDPVGAGLAKTIARPGSNITGVSLQAGDYA
jgi:putative tryptophan/tyrosine transport system substrate-binding protein